MRSCKTVQNDLSAYLHHELDRKNLLAMHQHLSQCQACLQHEIELRHTSRLLSQFKFEALPENFDWELMKKIDRLQMVHKKVKPRFRHIIYAVAATLILFIGLEFIIFQFRRSPLQSIQFSDYTTTQTVFKVPADGASRSSLAERYAEKYQKQKDKITFQKNL